MIVQILKRDGLKKTETVIDVKVKSYRKVAEPKGLFLAAENNYKVEEEPTAKVFNFFKVLFLASCETDLCKDELLIAFFVNDDLFDSDFKGHIITDLEGNVESHLSHYNPNVVFIDYQSYLDICELTGEKKLTLIEVLKARLEGRTNLNSLLVSKEGDLNTDQQTVFYQIHDQANKR